MELRQLTYFVAVAEEEQFTRGSERVSVAQPAVSAQIKQLESELGETLFHRGQRRATLTEAGQAFLPYARAALAVGRPEPTSRNWSIHASLTRHRTTRPTNALFSRAVTRIVGHAATARSAVKLPLPPST